MSTQNKIAVIGSGSWATAIVKMLCNNHANVGWYVRNPENIEHIKKYHHNPNYISSVEFEVAKLSLESDVKNIFSSYNFIVLAVPSAFIHDTLKSLTKDDFKNKVMFSAIKGIVPERNLIIGEYLNTEFDVPFSNIGVITGPCHAEEVAMEKLSYLTVASQTKLHADFVADSLKCRFIKCSVSDDIYGTEYAAVLKNIYALASGIFHGLGYGDNFQAVLISNAIQEMKRYVDAVHPIDRDIKDSAYLGDLLVTAYSQFSRNRTFGMMIGKGYSVKAAQLEMNMVAEGYYASKCVYEINKTIKAHIPIVDSVYRILYEKMAPSIEMKLLANTLS